MRGPDRDDGRGRFGRLARSGGDGDPGRAGALAAMDAALAGEPVDPEYAELYELARLVAEERPEPLAGELAALDDAVAARSGFPSVRREGRPRRRVPRPLLGGAAAALAAGALAAIVVALPSGGGESGSTAFVGTVSSSSSAASAGGAAGSAGAAGGSGAAGASSTSGAARSAPPPQSGNFFGPYSAPSAAASAAPHPSATPGRQVVQGAQLNLATAPSRMDQVAQEVFDVVGSENGIVERSTVNSGGAANAYATFSLSIPSVNLPQALRLLSTLRGAQVLSRTDSTSDITGTVGAAGQRLAEDRALRASLLRRLAAASTDTEAAALRGQLGAVDARISADTGRLRGLHHQVADSRVTVTIQPATPGPRPVHHSGGFTLGRSLHVAGRVLVVAAGVALIALAVALPLGLVGALVAWLWLALRRRRREAVLDLL